MFMSLVSHILWYVSAHPVLARSCVRSAWFAFALPSYSTYKALAHSASADTLQALSTYWAVIGAFLAFEQSLGLFLSWSVLPFSSPPCPETHPRLPFYWELRTVFLLYISLPQTQVRPPFMPHPFPFTTPLQGSTYVYKTCLEPWFSKNEADLDVAMVSAQTNVVAFCRTRIAALLDFVWSFLNNTPVSGQSTPDGDAQKPAAALTISVDHLKGLWTTYGPSVLAAFAPKDTTDAHASSGAHEEVQAK
jgi:receptor expression-enhancing protein 1/2/3/4